MSGKSFKVRNVSISVADTVEDAKTNFANSLEHQAKVSITARNQFLIGVSGGSLINTLAEEILPKLRTDFKKWKIFFCDERMVPFDHPESTYGLYKEKLLGKFPGLTQETFVPVNTSLSVEEAAKDYESKLRSYFPYEYKDPLPSGQAHFPRFDCLLLGLGPDGHTCSLFPGHPLMKEKTLWVAPIKDSPKPPPERVTLTFPVLHKSRNIILFLTGEGKADIIKRILVDCEKLPGFYINTTEPNCDVIWHLDAGAGSKIPRQKTILESLEPDLETMKDQTPIFPANSKDIAY
uniref:6-phosphogluconolactonase n=1 Tax=Cacopsylla melanoneura TaxID=428564 RepID=A0A8D8UY63_9HEMI